MHIIAKISENSHTVKAITCTEWKSYILLSGIVGEMENDGQDLYIWTHKKFEIGYNGNQVKIF